MSSSNSKKFLQDPEARKQIMLDHYECPRNFCSDNKCPAGYQSGNTNSPSCIDNVTAYVLVKDNKVKDIKFGGESCTICKSSTDIMASTLVGKTVEEALDFIKNYMNMIDHKEFNDAILDELIVFDNIWRQSNRVNCAKTGINAIKKALEKYVK